MNLNKTRRPDDKQLLAGLDECTAHADALAEPLPHELAPYRARDGEALHDAQSKEPSGEPDGRAGHDSSAP